MTLPQVAIVSACRTPIGSFGGALSALAAPQLGSIAIGAALARAGLRGEEVSEVIMGQVLTAGVGQAPARQASMGAGLPDAVPCSSVNKVCGSGLQAVILGAQAICAGAADVVVAGGMESMSQAPYLLERARSGYGLGHGVLTDSLLKDGLWDVYNDFHMGDAAELCARECGISRRAQDEFAVHSYQKAQAAQEKGYFREEIVPVAVEERRGRVLVDEDEEPRRADFARLGSLDTLGARLSRAYLQASGRIGAQLAAEGVAASPEELRAVLVEGFHHLYGPFDCSARPFLKG